MAAKKQKVVHLSQAEWLLQRPENFLGPMEPAETQVPVFADDGVAWRTELLRPGLLTLLKELLNNASDNAVRDDAQQTRPILIRPHALVRRDEGDARRIVAELAAWETGRR